MKEQSTFLAEVVWSNKNYYCAFGNLHILLTNRTARPKFKTACKHDLYRWDYNSMQIPVEVVDEEEASANDLLDIHVELRDVFKEESSMLLGKRAPYWLTYYQYYTTENAFVAVYSSCVYCFL